MLRNAHGTVAALLVAMAIASCRQGSGAGQQGGNVTVQHGLTPRDELLLAAANVALPPPGVTPADLPDPASPGAQLVSRYCAQCHDLPSPAMHSATDWPSVTRRMWLRMEWLSPTLGVKVPTMAERFALLGYLTNNALKVSGTTLPRGQGRDEFSRVCSRCHALPDPRVHSREDWPTVFARMEQNMERMKVPPLTRSETTDILLYLQMVASRQ
jgi:cytochrome c5